MDEIEVTILPDGRIKLTTSRFSPALHVNAEQFLANVVKLAGGAVDRKHKPGGSGHTHGHSHEHGHGHAHGGHSHG